VSTTRPSRPYELADWHNHYLTIKLFLKQLKDPATRVEGERELRRLHDEGLLIGKYKEMRMARKSRRPAPPADATTFTGQGILFAVVADREGMGSGTTSTVDIIAQAIEKALDAGHETSDDIARYLTTSAFQHVPDKRVRFNAVLKAGDSVGAQMLRKLYNGYNDLIGLAQETEATADKKALMEEARGFAECLQIVLSPFSVELPGDPRLVDWDEVDRLTAAFEKEQRYIIKERQGNPQ
jgi:hypothetical protein